MYNIQWYALCIYYIIARIIAIYYICIGCNIIRFIMNVRKVEL